MTIEENPLSRTSPSVEHMDEHMDERMNKVASIKKLTTKSLINKLKRRKKLRNRRLEKSNLNQKHRNRSSKAPIRIKDLINEPSSIESSSSLQLLSPRHNSSSEVDEASRNDQFSITNSNTSSTNMMSPESYSSNVSSPNLEISEISIVPNSKQKGNSLSRVMLDRELLLQNAGSNNKNTMEFSHLIKNLNEMNLDMSKLENLTLNLKCKNHPLPISHLPNYDKLHPTEGQIASLLRLTPVQYLTSKNTLLSASRRYQERLLPFRKSDAQKMLRMDVNKTSELWEFFRQASWL